MYDVDLELLRCFVAVAESKSFTVAGLKTNKSQSAVSMRIKKLETHYNTALLQRNSRQVVLTSQGEKLLVKAKALLNHGESLHHLMMGPTITGHIRIGLLEYIAPHRIAEIMAAVKASLPDASVSFRIGLSSELNSALANGLLDLTLTLHNSDEVSNTLIAKDELVWVAGHSGVIIQNSALQLCLMKAPCVYRMEALSLLEQYTDNYEEITTSSSILSVRELVKAGAGISLLGRSSVGDGIQVIDLSDRGIPQPEREMAVGLVGEHTHKPAIESIFNEILKQSFVSM